MKAGSWPWLEGGDERADHGRADDGPGDLDEAVGVAGADGRHVFAHILRDGGQVGDADVHEGLDDSVHALGLGLEHPALGGHQGLVKYGQKLVAVRQQQGAQLGVGVDEVLGAAVAGNRGMSRVRPRAAAPPLAPAADAGGAARGRPGRRSAGPTSRPPRGGATCPAPAPRPPHPAGGAAPGTAQTPGGIPPSESAGRGRPRRRPSPRPRCRGTHGTYSFHLS